MKYFKRALHIAMYVASLPIRVIMVVVMTPVFVLFELYEWTMGDHALRFDLTKSLLKDFLLT